MISFTPEDLLQYLYKETSTDKNLAIETALQKDWTLCEKLNVLKTSMYRLDKITVAPRIEVILNVLKYAREKTTAEV